MTTTPAPLYYADGPHVWKRAVASTTAAGVRCITMGFQVCTATDFGDDRVAAFIAAALNAYDTSQDQP